MYFTFFDVDIINIKICIRNLFFQNIIGNNTFSVNANQHEVLFLFQVLDGKLGFKDLLKRIVSLSINEYSTSGGTYIYIAVGIFCTAINKLVAVVCAKRIIVSLSVFINSDDTMVFCADPDIPIFVFHDFVDGISAQRRIPVLNQKIFFVVC